MTKLHALCPLDKQGETPATILANAAACVRRIAITFPGRLVFDAGPLAAESTRYASIDEARRGVHGHIGNAPLACALAMAVQAPKDPEEALAFDRLLVTWLVAVRDHGDRLTETHADAMRAAGLSLRHALRKGLPAALKEELLAADDPPTAEDLVGGLQRLIAEQAAAEAMTGASPGIHPLAGLERALSFLLGERGPRPRSPGGTRTPRASSASDETAADAQVDATPGDATPDASTPPDPASAPTGSTPEAPAEPAPSTAPQASPRPDSSDVWRGTTGHDYPRPPPSLEAPRLGRPSPFTRRIERAQAQTLRLARPHLLGQAEGEVLRQCLKDAPAEVRVTVAAALYLGEHLPLLAQTPVLDDWPRSPAELGERAWLRTPAPGLVVRNHVNDHLPEPVARADAPALATHLWLPLDERLPGAAGLIAWAQRRPVGAPLLTLALVAQANAWLKATRHEAHLGVTLRRLTQQLGREMTHVTGDRLLGQLIGPPPLASYLRARMAYRQYPAGVVMDAYARTTCALGARLGHAGAHDLTPLPPPALRGTVVGSQRAPEPEVLAAWAQTLRDAVPPMRRGRLSWSFLRSFHNAYLLYVLTSCLVTGGVRITAPGFATAGVVGPVDSLDSADPLPAIRLVDDKARRRRDGGAQDASGEAAVDGADNVRVVPATPEQCRQARWWRRHLAVVARHVTGPLPTWPWLGARRGQVQAMTPALWEATAQPPVAPNAGRHCLATQLLRAGIPAHRVNQFLGHAALGEETGNPWSAAEPRATPGEMAAWRAIEARMGFIAVEGLGRG